MVLGRNISQVLSGPAARRCAFWRQLFPQLGGGSFDGKQDDFFSLGTDDLEFLKCVFLVRKWKESI